MVLHAGSLVQLISNGAGMPGECVHHPLPPGETVKRMNFHLKRKSVLVQKFAKYSCVHVVTCFLTDTSPGL